MDPRRIACGLTCLFFTVTMISGFEGIGKGKDEHDQWKSTTCKPLNTTTIISRCCVVDACSCLECVLTNPLCTNLESQSLNQSLCCGGYSCCQTRCSKQCTRQTCTGSGSDRQCRTTSYCCETECAISVRQETCTFRCGTCADFSTEFVVEATGLILTGVHSHCGINDLACRQAYLDTYQKQFPCYYDSKNPKHVRLSHPDYSDGYKAGIAFVVICGLVTIVSCCICCAVQSKGLTEKRMAEKILPSTFLQTNFSTPRVLIEPSAPPAYEEPRPPPYEETVSLYEIQKHEMEKVEKTENRETENRETERVEKREETEKRETEKPIFTD